MSEPKEKSTLQPPKLDLVRNSVMYAEFVDESLRYLVSAQNSLAMLERAAGDREAQDNLFKIFYAIAGLADFLQLTDIHLLSEEAGNVLEKVRKGLIVFDDDTAAILLNAISALYKLLSLLNEQVSNAGHLSSPYFDVRPAVSALQNVKNQEASSGKIPTSKNFSADLDSAVGKYQELESQLRSASGDILINADLLRGVLGDLSQLEKQMQGMYGRLLSRQRELAAERDLALELSQQALDTAKTKGDFLASMAHEIRTLISAILGFSELLLKSLASDKHKTQLRTIISSGKLLLHIVNNILDFSKIEKGKLILEHINFDLNNLVEDVLKIVRAKVEGKPVKLSFHIDKDVPQQIFGDPTRLKQILINLLDNAIKFTDQGEVSLSIIQKEITLSTHEVILEFTVKDTGPGIPADKRSLIFQSFTQADGTVTRKYGGTGLGLSICKSYVEAMGGKIWVESTEGKGSSFIFTMKAKVKSFEGTAASSDEVFSRDAGFEESTQEDDLKDSCKGLRVFVVDDSVSNQELIQAYFEYLGCTGDFAVNGREAIEKIKTNKYDVCFMDVQMPFMGGFEATRLIRENVNQHLPIIALTATKMSEEREQYLKSGMTDYLEKPFDMAQMKEKILRHSKKVYNQ
ncbi:MAG: ATP-binding protein [Candidatus Omnitrophota bacterium]